MKRELEQESKSEISAFEIEEKIVIPDLKDEAPLMEQAAKKPARPKAKRNKKAV